LIIIDHHKQSFSSQKAFTKFALIFKLKLKNILKSRRRRRRRRQSRRRRRHRWSPSQVAIHLCLVS